MGSPGFYRHTSENWYPVSPQPIPVTPCTPFDRFRIESGMTTPLIVVYPHLKLLPSTPPNYHRQTAIFLAFVIPVHDRRDSGGRAKQEARAEAGIQSSRSLQFRWILTGARMTSNSRIGISKHHSCQGRVSTWHHCAGMLRKAGGAP